MRKNWKKVLTAQQYYVLREKGTEAPFSGQYHNFFEEGIYRCAGCGQSLFQSNHKYESHCEWPSFDASIPGSTEYQPGHSYFMSRTEVVCSKCKGHLGHLFNDGPTKIGQRFCMNSAALKFEKTKKNK